MYFRPCTAQYMIHYRIKRFFSGVHICVNGADALTKWIWWYSLILKRTRKNCFRYLKLMSPLNAAICTTISYTLWVEWYYLKNNNLTLRSNVKIPQRSLWYVTHHLMVMHPHTKYHWPISKDKNVMAQTRKYYMYLKNNYLTLRSKVEVQRRSLLYATHRLMVMHPHTKYHDLSRKT